VPDFQEIDGKALSLLTSDLMMKFMGLKLGPALKISNIIAKIKGRKHFAS
jgi:polycomb protein SCMH1